MLYKIRRVLRLKNYLVVVIVLEVQNYMQIQHCTRPTLLIHEERDPKVT
jgi:hypothetical protein